MELERFKYAGVVVNSVVDIELIVCPKCLCWFGVDRIALDVDGPLFCPYCGKISEIPGDEPVVITSYKQDVLPLLGA